MNVLLDLAEDPWIRWRHPANHHGITAGLRHDRKGILWRADIAIADHRNRYRLFHRCNPFPSGVSAIALLASTGMQRDRTKAQAFGDTSQFHAHNFVVTPPSSEFHGERNLHRSSH